MGSVAKKSKEKKNSEMEKIRECAEKHPCMAVVANPDIPNAVLKKMRDDFSGHARILFIKKKMARTVYNIPDMPKDPFFLMFGERDVLEGARSYQYGDFLEAGDICPVRAVIERQIVRDKAIAELLPVSTKDKQTQLLEDYVVCDADETVDERTARILRFFGKRLRLRTLSVESITPSADMLK